jgi:hypothetical protein
MPSIADCIVKLVNAGSISPQKGDEAVALYRRSLAEFTARHLPPADAQAAAALATAKTMAAGARQARNDAAKQALAWHAYESAQAAYPAGKRAYIVDTLTPSLRDTGLPNVQSRTENLWNYFVNRLTDDLQKMNTQFWGRSANQIERANNIVRELHGVTTGDAPAANLAKAYSSVTDEAALRARSAGKNFPFNRDWVMPQEWVSAQVREVPEAQFVSDWNTHVQSGAVRLWNKEKDRWALPNEYNDILRTAYQDIRDRGATARPFDPMERTFNFSRNAAGAEAHLEMMQKYGRGDDVMGLLLGHVNKMSREIALAEVIGPNHDAIIQAALRHARTEASEEQVGIAGKFRAVSPRAAFESVGAAERTYKTLTGEADALGNSVSSQVWSDLLGGVRSLNSAAKLAYAVPASIPGDTVNAVMAEFHTGMMPGRIIGRMVKEMALALTGNPEARTLSQRLMVTSHAVADMNHTSRFYLGQLEGLQRAKALSTATIRAAGLGYWSDLIKRTFSLEMLATLAERSGTSLADMRAGGPLDSRLARFLERYGISDNDWDHIRLSQHHNVGGAVFIDPAALNRDVREKLLEGIIGERRFALVEPSARVRAISTGGGLPQSSIMGQVARNGFLFKSFSLSMMESWMARAATQGSLAATVGTATQVALVTTFAGALAIQAKSILQGKGPQDMNSPNFWLRAFLEGGAVGPAGSALTGTLESKGYQRGAVGELILGPVGGTLEDILTLAGQGVKAIHGKETTPGRAVVNLGKHLTPGTWYTKIATDRLIWDQLQKYIDPQHGQSFERTRKYTREQTGAKYWWGPGEALPKRTPEMGTRPVDQRSILNRPLFK